jgi:hypothetical protein
MKEKDELKRNKKFMVSIIAWPIITLTLLMLLILLFTSGVELKTKYFIGSFGVFFCLGFGWITYLEYTVGKAYYRIYYRPIDKFIVKEYSNFMALVDSNNFAHVYREQSVREKIRKLEKIKIYQYYTLKKKTISYELAIHEQ